MNLSIQQYKRILINMKYEKFERGQVVFHYGDQGDKFYLIIEGQVDVWVPKNFKIDLKQRNAEIQASIETQKEQ